MKMIRNFKLIERREWEDMCCFKGERGEPGIKGNLVSLFINNSSNDIHLFINGKQKIFDEELDYSMVDGKLSLDIDITSIEKKHNIRDSQISVLYKPE